MGHAFSLIKLYSTTELGLFKNSPNYEMFKILKYVSREHRYARVILFRVIKLTIYFQKYIFIFKKQFGK